MRKTNTTLGQRPPDAWGWGPCLTPRQIDNPFGMSKSDALKLLGAAREGQRVPMIQVTAALWVMGDIDLEWLSSKSESEDHSYAHKKAEQ